MSETDSNINKLKEQTIKHNIQTYKDRLKEIRNKEQTLLKLIDDGTKELYSICEHKFIRERTTSGCYAEYHNVCQKCNMTQW